MRNVRFHHDPSPPGCAGGSPSADCRLNLLLSDAGWHPDPWVDRLPRLLEPMGVRALQARTGAEATRVIEREPIHIAVVDLGLPLDEDDDRPEAGEGGIRLLELLKRLDRRPPTVVIKPSRTARDDMRQMHAALRLGAFAVVDRPRDSRDLELMLEVLRRVLQRFYAGRWPAGGSS